MREERAEEWTEAQKAALAALSPADRRLIMGIRQLMPNYRFELSYLVKKCRSIDRSNSRASSSSTDLPAASRSDKVE